MAWDKKRRRNIFDLFNEFFDSVFTDFDDDFAFRNTRTSQPRKKNVKGFSVRIRQVPGQQPKVEVQKFGPKGVKKVKEPGKKVRVVEEGGKKPKKKMEKLPADVEFKQPEVEEGQDEKGKYVELEMPGIEDSEQINLNIMEKSIEVKAINHNKNTGYFWIVKIPSGAKKVKRVWKDKKFRLYFR